MKTITPTGPGKILRIANPNFFGSMYVLYNFDSGGDALKKEFNGVLDTLAAIAKLAKRLGLKVELVIEATADPTGNAIENQRLSRQRAARVVAFLVSHGVDSTICEVKPYGADSRTRASSDAFLRIKAGRTKITPKGGNELDRAVQLTMLQHRPPRGPIVDFKREGWDRLFSQVRTWVTFDIMCKVGMDIADKHAPSPSIKGVPVPTGSPMPAQEWNSEEKVKRAIRNGVIVAVMQALRKQRVDISQAQVEAEYDKRYK